MARKKPTKKPGIAKREKLLTMSEIHRRTGIAMATLAKYVRQAPRKFASEGKGRRRRYYPSALNVFVRLRKQSRRGPKPGSRRGAGPSLLGFVAATSKLRTQVRRIDARQKKIQRQVSRLLRLAIRPLRIRLER